MTELAKTNTTSLVNPQEAMKEEEPSWLPMIKLLQSMSQEVSDGEGVLADLYCAKQNLGKETLIVVAGYRWHALLMEDGKKTVESYNLSSPISKQLKRDDDARKRKYPEYDIRRGIESLCWIPAINTFATLHPNTWAGRSSGISQKIINSMTPIADRGEAAKKLPVTNFFQLQGKVIKGKYTYAGFGIETRTPDPSQASTPEQLATALEQFTAPVRDEGEMQESTDDR